MMEILSLAIAGCASIVLVSFFIILCGNCTSKENEDSKPELTSLNRTSSVTDVESNTEQPASPPIDSLEEDPSTQNPYEEPETVKAEVKALEAKQTNGEVSNGSSSVSVVNERSPENTSQRSSRLSNHSRLPSQDRALPEIPNASSSSRQSRASEKSPSTSRALPEVPPPEDPYDHLDLDIPAHQIKSKSSAKSTAFRFNDVSNDEDMSSEEIIQPDEVTRNSITIVVSKQMSCETHPLLVGSPSQEKTAVSNVITPGSKKKVQYSKIVKQPSTDKDQSAKNTAKPLSDNAFQSEEPEYAEAPPVPDKNYNIDEERNATVVTSAHVIVDESAQDSGSGYYAVPDDGPTPNLDRGVTNIEGYDTLTAREPLDQVRNRQVEENDDYESVEEANGNKDGGSELYSEIDNQNTASSNRNPGSALQVPVAQAEDLYAEIDMDTGKGEQIDSAGYAVVRELNPRPHNHQLHNDDDDDYAECDSPLNANSSTMVNGASSNSAENLLGASAAIDLDDDYAVINTNREKSSAYKASPDEAGTTAAAGTSSLPNGNHSVNANGETPFQKYKRREHVYDEIAEVKSQTPKAPDGTKKK